MTILLSTIFKVPVYALDIQAKVGFVDSYVIDPKDGRLIGFLIRKNFFKPLKILAFDDVIEINANAIVTKAEEQIMEVSEIVRAKDILNAGIKVLNQKVVTNSRKSIGRVEDLLVNTQTGMITKYYVKTLLESRIIPAEKVIKITHKEIVVQDDVLESKIQMAAEAAA